MIGIVSGGLSLALEATASAATAILGGTVATGFGLAAFFDDTHYEFRHPRNILKEVWEGPEEPALIPKSVWRHLNRPLLDDPDRQSLRETLIARLATRRPVWGSRLTHRREEDPSLFWRRGIV
jgi:hypothetical protein